MAIFIALFVKSHSYNLTYFFVGLFSFVCVKVNGTSVMQRCYMWHQSPLWNVTYDQHQTAQLQGSLTLYFVVKDIGNKPDKRGDRFPVQPQL